MKKTLPIILLAIMAMTATAQSNVQIDSLFSRLASMGYDVKIQQKKARNQMVKRSNAIIAPCPQTVLDSIRSTLDRIAACTGESYRYENHKRGFDTIQYSICINPGTEAANVYRAGKVFKRFVKEVVSFDYHADRQESSSGTLAHTVVAREKLWNTTYNNDTVTRVHDGAKVQARYCLTYDDFVNKRWHDAGTVSVKVKNGDKTLSSGRQEYKFTASNRKTTNALRRDALVVEMDSQLFVNQQSLYHYISHFGHDYTRCFAIGDSIVFVGDMKFGNRWYEERYGILSSTSFPFGSNEGINSASSMKYRQNYIAPGEPYFEANPNGVYCFMLNNNSMHAKKLRGNINEMLYGTPVEVHPYSISTLKMLNGYWAMFRYKLPIVSKHRHW